MPAIDAAIDAVASHQTQRDPWGFEPSACKRYYTLAYWISRYFRPEVTGLEQIPSGRVLLVPNHSGQLPFDGLVIAVSTLLAPQNPRLLRPMVERWVPSLPYINIVFSRSGVVLGDPINCRNLLEADQPILVFPEGAKGSGKTWQRRYQLTTFGRGFMRLALQTRTPIVPVSVVGAEEAIPTLYNATKLAALLKMPYFPLPALLPLLGPLAYLPLPTKFYVRFGAPMRFKGRFDDEDGVIDRKVKRVKTQIETMLSETLTARPSIF